MYTLVCNSIYAYVHKSSSDTDYDYQVVTPSVETAVGKDSSGNETYVISSIYNGWVGLGYVEQRSPKGESDWSNMGFMIVGYRIENGVAQSLENPHGGVVTTTPNYATATSTTLANYLKGIVGDPINTANGDVMHDETDFSIPNYGVELSFTRHYHSFYCDTDLGMGYGWTFSYSDTLTFDTSNNATWITDLGVRLTFVYNSGTSTWTTPDSIYGTLSVDGTGHKWTDKTGKVVKWNSSGQLTQILDRYGDGVDVAHDSSGHITTVSDHLDSTRKLTFAYSGSHIVSITDFAGRVWQYGYNSSSLLVSVTSPTDSTVSSAKVTYDYYTDTTRNKLLKSVTDRDGDKTQYAYYANRRGMSVTNAAGVTHYYSFDLYRQCMALTDEQKSPTYYYYDDDGNLTKEVFADRTTEVYTWTDGLMMSDTDAFGQTESYLYDSNGNMTQLTDRLSRVTTYTYTTYSNVDVVTKPGSIVTNYDYYSDGSLYQVTDALGYITRYTYPTTDRGLPLTMTTPKGVLTTGDLPIM